MSFPAWIGGGALAVPGVTQTPHDVEHWVSVLGRLVPFPGAAVDPGCVETSSTNRTERIYVKSVNVWLIGRAKFYV